MFLVLSKRVAYPMKKQDNVYVLWFFKNPYVKTKRLIFLNCQMEIMFNGFKGGKALFLIFLPIPMRECSVWSDKIKYEVIVWPTDKSNGWRPGSNQSRFA